MRDIETRGYIARIVNILARAAGVLSLYCFTVIIELQCNSDDVIAGFHHQGSRNRRVDTTGHGNDDTSIFRVFLNTKRIHGRNMSIRNGIRNG